jgi:hypothetical protein
MFDKLTLTMKRSFAFRCHYFGSPPTMACAEMNAAALTLVSMKTATHMSLSEDPDEHSPKIIASIKSPMPIEIFRGLHMFARVSVFKDERVLQKVLPCAWRCLTQPNLNITRDFLRALHGWAIMMPDLVLTELKNESRMYDIEECILLNLGLYDDVASAGMSLIVELCKHFDISKVVKSHLLQSSVRIAFSGHA